MLAVAAVGCGDANDDAERFRADLSGANEVPAKITGASGVADISFDGTAVTFSIVVNGITAVTGAHIHSGAPGINGPIRVGLFPGPGSANFGPPTGALNGVLVQGSFAAADVTGVTLEALLTEMRNQAAYVNVHTSANPAGEIRGQVRLQP